MDNNQLFEGNEKMKERPILFSGAMVQAILDGRKTQTRRVVNYDLASNLEDGWGKEVQKIETDDTPMGGLPVTEWCPYGMVGDRLWVRETFALLSHDATQELNPMKTDDGCLWFRADPTDKHVWDCELDKWKWRPSIHMPRWASRITLEITAVRVDRLQDITEADARAEGCNRIELGPFEVGGMPVHPMTSTYKEAFKGLWDSINGKRKVCTWNDNPWVWVVEFKKEQN